MPCGRLFSCIDDAARLAGSTLTPGGNHHHRARRAQGERDEQHRGTVGAGAGQIADRGLHAHPGAGRKRRDVDTDPLRDGGELLGDRLRADGVPVTSHRFLGELHGSSGLIGVSEDARQWHAEVASIVRGFAAPPFSEKPRRAVN